MATGVAFVPLLIFLVMIITVIFAVALLVRGMRGYPSLAAPSCMKCGYDLRGFAGEPPTTCSECGADLTARHAIRLARFQRDTRATVLGLLLLLLVPLCFLGLRFLMTSRQQQARVAFLANSPMGIAAQTNAAIIANLANTANIPWPWQELDRRFKSGALSSTDVTAAVDAYIRWRSTAGPNTSAGPLSWASGFLTDVYKAQRIPAAQFDRLEDAFFGKDPAISIDTTLQLGKPVHFEVQCGGPWDLFGRQPIYALSSVMLDDRAPIVIFPQYASGPTTRGIQRLSSTAPGSIAAMLLIKNASIGPHRLTFNVDTATTDFETHRLFDSQEVGQSDRWPSNIAPRRRQVVIPITIVAHDAPAVQLQTDTAHHDWPPVKLTSVVALPGDNGTRIKILMWALTTDVDYTYDVSVDVNGHHHSVGFMDHHRDWGSSNAVDAVERPALPPSVNTVTVTFTPDLARAAQTPGVSRIWNIPIEFKNVPLRRLDLPAATQPVE